MVRAYLLVNTRRWGKPTLWFTQGTHGCSLTRNAQRTHSLKVSPQGGRSQHRTWEVESRSVHSSNPLATYNTPVWMGCVPWGGGGGGGLSGLFCYFLITSLVGRYVSILDADGFV